jgi:hypothetical protein
MLAAANRDFVLASDVEQMASSYRRIRNKILVVPSLIPVRIDRQEFERIGHCESTNLSGCRELLKSLLYFSVTADQQGQEQDKHQDAEQDFERLPDVYTRGWGSVVTVLCLFDTVSNPPRNSALCST